MSNTPETWEIKYFVNPHREYPCQAIVVFESKQKLFARFPRGETVEIPDWYSILSNMSDAVVFSLKNTRDRVNSTILKDEYWFLLSDRNILIGTHNKIREQLLEILETSELDIPTDKIIDFFKDHKNR
jgi:hypothetical protein